MSSGATFSAFPGAGAYTSSKAGLNMLAAVARAELESTGISVSTMYPSVTDTEFYESMRTGTEGASPRVSTGLQAQPPELVAEAILDLGRTGAEQADLVPEQYGGSYKG